MEGSSEGQEVSEGHRHRLESPALECLDSSGLRGFAHDALLNDEEEELTIDNKRISPLSIIM
jgi:hypothetical protein